MPNQNENSTYKLKGKKLIKFVIFACLMLLSSISLFACTTVSASTLNTNPTNVGTTKQNTGSQNTTNSSLATNSSTSSNQTNSSQTNQSGSDTTTNKNEVGADAWGDGYGTDTFTFIINGAPERSFTYYDSSLLNMPVTKTAKLTQIIKTCVYYSSEDFFGQTNTAVRYATEYTFAFVSGGSITIGSYQCEEPSIYYDSYYFSGNTANQGLTLIEEDLTCYELATILGFGNYSSYPLRDLFLGGFSKPSEYLNLTYTITANIVSAYTVEKAASHYVYNVDAAYKINWLFDGTASPQGVLVGNTDDLIITAHYGNEYSEYPGDFQPHGGHVAFNNFKTASGTNIGFLVRGVYCSTVSLNNVQAAGGYFYGKSGQEFSISNCTFDIGWKCYNQIEVHINNSTLPGELFNRPADTNIKCDIYIEGGTYSNTTIYSFGNSDATKYISNNYSNLYITGGTFNCLIENSATMTITGGTFNGEQVTDIFKNEYYGIEESYTYLFSLNNKVGGVATINGGVEFAGKVSNSGTLTIKDGTFNGVYSGVTNCLLKITGGIFNYGLCRLYYGDMEGLNTTYGALYVFGVEISGGTFNSEVYLLNSITITSGLFNNGVDYYGSAIYTAIISGGTFNGSVINSSGKGVMDITAGTFSGVSNSGTLTISGGTFNEGSILVSYLGNVSLSLYNTNTATVKKGTFVNKLINRGTSLNITGGTFKETITNNNNCTIEGGTFEGAITNEKYLVNSASGVYSGSAQLTINGGNFTGDITNSVVSENIYHLQISGETTVINKIDLTVLATEESYTPILIDGNCTINEISVADATKQRGKTYYVASDANEALGNKAPYKITGIGHDSEVTKIGNYIVLELLTSYYINTLEDLIKFNNKTIPGVEGDEWFGCNKFIITADITVPESSNWQGITTFGGEATQLLFDGGGNTITFENSSNGLIKTIANNVTIQNVKITGNIIGNDYSEMSIGAIANIIAEDSTVTINNCYFRGHIQVKVNFAGGIIGEISLSSGSVTIANCISNGVIEGEECVGGIVGYFAFVSSQTSSQIVNCINYSVLKNPIEQGGIMGITYNENGGVNYCYSFGNIFGFRPGTIANKYTNSKFNCNAFDIESSDYVYTANNKNYTSEDYFYNSTNVKTMTNMLKKNILNIVNGTYDAGIIWDANYSWNTDVWNDFLTI